MSTQFDDQKAACAELKAKIRDEESSDEKYKAGFCSEQLE